MWINTIDFQTPIEISTLFYIQNIKIDIYVKRVCVCVLPRATTRKAM